jgi:hypothetical protein
MVIYCRNNNPHKVADDPALGDDDGWEDLEAIAQQMQLERDAVEELRDMEQGSRDA